MPMNKIENDDFFAELENEVNLISFESNLCAVDLLHKMFLQKQFLNIIKVNI